KNFDMFFTGDMDSFVERRLLKEHRDIEQGRELEVLKVAHHGSATASCEEFLQWLRPKIACISVGENNHYGHPAKEVMERLSQSTERIYLTKDCGAITIETDGTRYSVKSFLDK
ncbi:MAG: DNA internalization-related competence protein ComEC/Rec2, partial [Lachnospiraceae bacterium]|nr:DNA internalization-related competence protein ComEC/Rec2 [Lachnospiraceae bacterium]